MWYLAYNILLILASPVILVTLLAKKRCRRGLAQRLGWSGPKNPDNPLLWVHAVSLGEVVAVAPLVRELRARYPGHRLVVSTVTETGREAVEQRLAGVAEHRYAPLDFPWSVSKVVEALRPAAFLFVETELWPNLLRALARRGVPAILVNGRLSSRSYRGYRIARPFFRQVLEAVSLCLMQSERDADRMIELGARPARVLRTGNIKFDQPLPDPTVEAAGPSRRAIGLAEQEELIVAGSTHAGEEEQLLTCYQRLHREFPALVLMLAPRHIERASEVEAAVTALGLPVIRRSALGKVEAETFSQGKRGRVFILDTRGELSNVYRHAALCFVGGTLVPVGGHNLLEPARWGKTVFFGIHTDHCAEVAALLLQAGGGVRVRDGVELAAAMATLLRNRQAMQRMGEAARAVVVENQGAVARTLELIVQALEGCAYSDEGAAPHVVPCLRGSERRTMHAE